MDWRATIAPSGMPDAIPLEERPIRIGVGEMRHPAEHRRESSALQAFTGGKGQRAHGAPMEGAIEADEARPTGMVARQLDGGLDRLRPGVGHEGPCIFSEWSDRI